MTSLRQFLLKGERTGVFVTMCLYWWKTFEWSVSSCFQASLSAGSQRGKGSVSKSSLKITGQSREESFGFSSAMSTLATATSARAVITEAAFMGILAGKRSERSA